MGKGKGKLAGWCTEVPAGIYLVELKNLRFGRTKYFLRLLQSRIAAKTTLHVRLDRNIPLVLKKSVSIKKDVVW